MHLTAAERKVMETVWSTENPTAKAVAAALKDSAQWSKTTSYTMITRCLNKGYIDRQDPHYLCVPKVTREQVSQWETEELLENYFGNSAVALVASLLKLEKLTKADLEKLLKDGE